MHSNADSSIETPSGPKNASEPLQSHRSERQSILTLTQPVPFDRALRTRNICALAILLGWLVSFCSIGTGVYMILSWEPIDPYFIDKNVLLGTTVYCFSSDYPYNMNGKGHMAYAMPKDVRTLISIGLTTAITILVDVMSYAHSTTLRWALIREGRLQKNSNLRLFSRAKSHVSNKWYANIISLLSLSIIYGAMASLVTDGDIVLQCDRVATPATSVEKEMLDFNGWGVMALGVGLLLQSLICTCSLYNSSIVATWSSHPMTNARAYSWWSCRSESVYDLNRCERTLLTKQCSISTAFNAPHTESTPESSGQGALSFAHSLVMRPQTRQQPMLSILPRACIIRYIVWAYFGAFAISSSVLGIAGSATGHLLQGDPMANGTTSVWESSAMIDLEYPTQFTYRPYWVGLLIQIVAQSFIFLGLHCIELIANVSRDESSWRKAASVGVNMNGSAIRQFVTSWQSMMLMALKPITHWVFGKAFVADVMVIMSLFPLITMAGLFLVSATFTEYLIRRKPKGYQPVTYGDIRRLSHYIDEWDETRIFWGDKGEISDGVRCAGTAGHRLCDIHPDAPYIGLVFT